MPEHNGKLTFPIHYAGGTSFATDDFRPDSPAKKEWNIEEDTSEEPEQPREPPSVLMYVNKK